MKIKIPATSANLGPGFDCLGVSLSLFNEVQITKAKISSISIKGEGENTLFLKKNNPFVQIFKQVYQKFSGEEASFGFKFHNHIPFSRGLGSSSAVIVGAVAAAFYFAQKGEDRQGILNEALLYEKHPDNIAPATLGGFVCSVVHQDKVVSVKNDIDESIQALILIPNQTISTKKSRNALAKKVGLKDCVFNLSHSSLLTACFLQRRYDLLKIASLDTLHQNQRMKAMPELFKVQKLALENGALMSVLSGSGSSFLSVAYKDDIEALCKKMKAKFTHCEVKIVNFDNKGFVFC